MNAVKIHIEFCEKWNYKPQFDRVSDIIKSYNLNVEISGNSIEPRSGAFEIEIDGKLVFSKFQTKKFPDSEEIYSWFH